MFVKPSSHRRHGQDKTVLSCRRCELNRRQVKTVGERTFRNCFVQYWNVVRTTENSVICLTEYSKSALTDHANQTNHTIDWKKTTVIDREQDRPTRWIKEAVHIRKEGHRAMNRDESSYQLSHAYDRLLDATAERRIKTRKNWVPASSDEDLVMRSKRQNKVLKCDIWIFYFVLKNNA